MFLVKSSPKYRNMHFVFFSADRTKSDPIGFCGLRPPCGAAVVIGGITPISTPNLAPIAALGGPSLRAVDTQNRVCEFRDRLQRRPRRFTMRLVSRPRDDSHIDRAIALFLRDLDLTHGPILVIHTLQDRDRHADI